jgi:response regulator RpfG family c-di-GMP phosphodiesterase
MSTLKFANKKTNIDKSVKNWKVLIVDDEPEIHTMTKTVLSSFELEGHYLEFFSAYNGSEAIEVLKENKDIAIVLLDVVMETDDAGLVTAKKIREELNNHLIRIILRTGQPGSAPEEEVIVKYRINDYKEKTELTSKKLFTAIVSSIRSYEDLITIKKNKDGLEKIIEATKSISEERSLELFAEGVLTQLISILNLSNDSLIINTNNALSIVKKNNDYRILASTGDFKKDKKFEDINITVKNLVLKHMESESSYFDKNHYVGYFKFNEDVSYSIYISGCDNINALDKKLTEIFSNNIAIAFNNLSLNKEMLDTQKEIIERLGEVVEKRSNEASKHVHRVAELSYLLAIDYGMEQTQAQLLKMASPMHDIGKIGIPDSILLKPGKLTDDEFDLMKTHSEIGYEILKTSKRDMLKAAAIVAHEHHERWDGTGYPSKIMKKDIHIFGRITAVADVFDALYHKRCYKEAWPLEDILKLFEEQKGKHFEPKLVELIFKNIDRYIKIVKLV